MAAKKQKRGMSPEHKRALAEGRAHGKAVREYLESLEATRAAPGRRATPESLRKRIDAVSEKIPQGDPVRRVALIQERMDLEAQLDGLEHAADAAGFEQAFIKVAAPYSAARGISYAAWREAGVPAHVLREAGISRAG